MRSNPALPLERLLTVIRNEFPNALGATLPDRRLAMPRAQHYSLTIEQQLGPHLTASLAYVGTQGRNLLRFTTPNLGPGVNLGLSEFDVTSDEAPFPLIFGTLVNRPRPVATIGAINRFETTATSRYDSLQLQMRGRSERAQYLVSYTFAKALDDVSDVFDLAGAPALPQNSLTLAGERAPANFDLRHRLAASAIYNFAPQYNNQLLRVLLWDLQIIGLSQWQTGQPFTVNSIFDVNLDGNLTDRLNTTAGLIVTGDRRQPLRIATPNAFSLLAPFGQDGRVARNTFRAGNVWELDLAVNKTFSFAALHRLLLRAEIFNLFNRANFGVPVRLLEAPGFGRATRMITPARRIQFSLKYSF